VDTLVFNVQLLLSLVVYGLLGKWFLLPRLDRLPRNEAILLCLIPQAFRQLGLYALVAATYQQFPEIWAKFTAFGDLATQLTSLAAMVLLRVGSPGAIPMVWLATVIGIVDTVISLYLSGATHVPLHSLYSAWFLSTFFLATVAWSTIYVIRYLLRKPR